MAARVAGRSRRRAWTGWSPRSRRRRRRPSSPSRRVRPPRRWCRGCSPTLAARARRRAGPRPRAGPGRGLPRRGGTARRRHREGGRAGARPGAAGRPPRRPTAALALEGETPFVPWAPRTAGDKAAARHAAGRRRPRARCAGVLTAGIKAEGPVHVDRLVRLAAGAFGLARVTEARRAALLAVLPPPALDGDWLWPAAVDRETWTGFRRQAAEQRPAARARGAGGDRQRDGRALPGRAGHGARGAAQPDRRWCSATAGGPRPPPRCWRRRWTRPSRGPAHRATRRPAHRLTGFAQRRAGDT